MAEFFDRWEHLEKPFTRNSYDGSGGGLLLVGPLRPGRLVVTAPHAVNHVREGTSKWADRGTGGLALLLAEVAGVTAVVADRNVGRDANYDLAHPLKDAVEALAPAAVLDLHGMRAREGKPAEVDIGTGVGLVPQQLLQRLEHHLSVSANTVGTGGSRPGTITGWAQRKGIPALQLEIGAEYRVPLASPANASRLVEGLAATVAAFD